MEKVQWDPNILPSRAYSEILPTHLVLVLVKLCFLGKILFVLLECFVYFSRKLNCFAGKFYFSMFSGVSVSFVVLFVLLENVNCLLQELCFHDLFESFVCVL